MFKKTALVAGIGLALSVTAQADYQWELDGGYTYGQLSGDLKNNAFNSGSDDVDENIGDLSGTWYMENVDTSKGPLSEAAFLDHASNVTLFGTYGQVDFGDDGQDEDGQAYGVDMRYVAEGPGWKLSGWLMDLGYEYTESGNDANADFYHIGIGKYLTSNWTAVVDYKTVTVNDGNDTDGYSLDTEYFVPFSNGGLKLNGSIGKVVVSDANDTDIYEAGGTWYLNNNLGFGAGYQKTSLSGGNDIEGWNVNADWFVSEAFAVDLSYGQSDLGDIEVAQQFGGGKVELQEDVARLGAKFRF